jgi:SAM-dependent methyltransferase
LFTALNSSFLPYHKLLDAFKNGGGINYEQIDQTDCARYKQFLTSDWINDMPELKSKLEKGNVAFADFGCGAGRSTLELAKAFPKSNFYGFDLFEPNIIKSNKNAEDAGVSGNITFIQWDVSNKLNKQFDFVACFDLIHDMTDPIEGLRTIREAVKDEGIFVLMDIKCEDDPANNTGPMAPFLYGMSLHFCMTTYLANNGAGLGTAGFFEAKVREYCQLVGFNNVKRIQTDHPLNAVYEIRPN